MNTGGSMGGRWSRRRARSWCGALGGLLLLASGAFLAWPVSQVAAQTEARSLVAAASAQGIRVTYTVPDLFVVSQFIDGGGPVAQASVDTTGKAISFASLPYPGENAVTAPGLISFLSGAPVPGYPFYARADYPVAPSAEVKDPSGTYVLSAKADGGKATGSANVAFGGLEKPVSRATADASGVIDDSGAKVSAVAVNQGLSFGEGTLRIASVTSRSVTTYAPGSDKPVTKAELIIEGAKVNDQAVTIGPDGVHPGGQTVMVPFGQGAAAINEALGKAGITVKTISSRGLDSGAASDILEVTVKHPVPGAANVQGTLVYEMGGTSSYIAFGDQGPGLPLAEPALPSGTGTGPTPPAQAGSATPAPANADLASSSSSSGLPPAMGAVPYPAALGSSPSGYGGSSGSGAGYGASPAGAPAVAPLVTAAPTPAALARDLRSTTRPLFSILVVAGALLLASSALWRSKGVQATWTP